jgi:hypothetical protein
MSAVTRAMNMLNEEYPGKFSLGTVTRDGEVPSRVRVWEHVLSEFDDETILHAALHLISTRPEWPPDVAMMRAQCVSLVSGELLSETGSEAWECIIKKVNHEDIDLTDVQKAALKQTGRTIFDLRNTSISNLATDRARYIEAFDKLVEKKRMERMTLPQVKAFAERNRPALPAATTKKLEGDTGQKMTYEEAKKEFGDEMTILKQMLGD